MFDWDDMRVFLAAARSGSLASASARLKIDPATVGRRIARLETALKATLLIRSRAGLEVTAVGARLIEATSAAEAAMEAAAEAIRPGLVSGTVRISASEGFGTTILAPALAGLHQERPHLRIELAANSGFLSPTRREVDMAITLSAPADSRLVVEPLASYQLALYASSGYLANHGAPASLDALVDHLVVGYVGDLIYAPELRYLDELRPDLTPRLASSSIRAQKAIIEGGGGIGVLPCFMAENLARVLPSVLIERRFWLSTHADVHGAARGKVVRAWIKSICELGATRLAPYAAPVRQPN